MIWFKKKKEKQALDVEQLRRVVALIPEYVECLVEEGRLRGAANAGLDDRGYHGPAERKLKKVEARLAEILARKPEMLPGAILEDEQRGTR